MSLRTAWGVRHIRYVWHAWRLARWVGNWAPYGYSHASQHDLDVLQAIWEGKT
jgi:hypothetical protein